MDNLARDAMLARQAGMTYGKWKAEHPRTKPDPNRHGPQVIECTCSICGAKFEWVGRRKSVCSDACYAERKRRTSRESYARLKDIRSYSDEGKD